MKLFFLSLTIISFLFSQNSANAAYTAFEKGDFKTAAELFDDYLDDNEDDHKARFQLAKAYFNLGEFADSTDEIEELIDQGVAKSEHYQFLWQAYVKEGEESGPLGRMSITKKLFNTQLKLSDLEPDSIRFQVHATFGLLNVPSMFGGDEERGLKKLAELKKISPYDADQIYFDRLLKQDKIEEATALLKEIEANANGRTKHYDQYHWYGQILLEKGMIQEAIAHYQKKIRLMPNVAYYHVELGNGYLAAKQMAKAKRAFEEALKIDPQSEKAQDALEELQNEKEN
jgi:tetratricopeptide (TPR) repeat protein